MDWKHILIKPPPNSGSYYFNYKYSFNIVLLAIVDADFKFLYVDIGCNSRISNGGVFKNSNIYRALEEKQLNIPTPTLLPGTQTLCPYVIVAYCFCYRNKSRNPILKLRERRVFNYRLSRARRIVENAFGILSNRFRVFMTPIGLLPEKVEVITMVCCTLHNFLRSRVEAHSVYMPPGS